MAFDKNIHKPLVNIIVPTVKEELSNLRQVLKNLPFYLDEGYQVTLPKHLSTGTKLSKHGLKKLFVSDIYQANLFKQAKKTLEKEARKLDKLFLRLSDYNRKWAFKIYPEYKIELTAYGSQGSYNPEQGSISIVVGPTGKIKDPHPINTLVHEIVHLGLQKGIVDKFNLSHWEKERLVDLICLRWLGKIVEKYELQEGGNNLIDNYIDDKAEEDLPQAIKRYTNDYPR